MATTSASEIRTGPAEILLGSTSVGHTEGDVIFHLGIQTRERKTAKHGENIVDLIHTGCQPRITFRVAQWVLANIQALLPGASVSGNAVRFGGAPGARLGDSAVALTIRPLKANPSTSEDIVIHRAVVKEWAEVSFNSEEDRVLEVTMVALVDETKADGQQLGTINVPTGA